MRGVDKALSEIQSARNRISRLYGLGRITQEDMVNAITKIEDAESVLRDISKREEDNVNVRRETTTS